MASRPSREAATSRGLRTGKTINGSAPKSLTTSIQKDRNRHIRGSFSTNKWLPLYSLSSTLRARSRNSPATGEACQAGSKACQSFQADSADARMSSLRCMMRNDSQNPASLLCALSLIKVLGKSHPSKFSTRVIAEVPLRCMPTTKIAFLIAALLASLLLLPPVSRLALLRMFKGKVLTWKPDFSTRKQVILSTA